MADLLRQTQARNGTVYVAGNGGSAANAAHMAAHLADAGIRAIDLMGVTSLVSARANDYSYENALWLSVHKTMGANDCVMVFSVSGRSSNIRTLLDHAREEKVPIIAIYGSAAEIRADAGVALDSRHYGAVEDAHSFILHALAEMLRPSRA